MSVVFSLLICSDEIISGSISVPQLVLVLMSLGSICCFVTSLSKYDWCSSLSLQPAPSRFDVSHVSFFLSFKPFGPYRSGSMSLKPRLLSVRSHWRGYFLRFHLSGVALAAVQTTLSEPKPYEIVIICKYYRNQLVSSATTDIWYTANPFLGRSASENFLKEWRWSRQQNKKSPRFR